MKPELNKLSVWRGMRAKGMSIRTFERYPYTEKGILRVSNKPVYRYAKNYKQEGKDFSLLMVSQDNDAKKIEAFMDDSAKKITKSDITGRLKSMGVTYGS